MCDLDVLVPVELFFFLLIRPPPSSTLFPYTTLFRSLARAARALVAAPARAGASTRLVELPQADRARADTDRKSTRLNSSHMSISYAVFCLKKKKFSRVHMSIRRRMIDSPGHAGRSGP